MDIRILKRKFYRKTFFGGFVLHAVENTIQYKDVEHWVNLPIEVEEIYVE